MLLFTLIEIPTGYKGSKNRKILPVKLSLGQSTETIKFTVCSMKDLGGGKKRNVKANPKFNMYLNAAENKKPKQN